jgi:hypothetical protein
MAYAGKDKSAACQSASLGINVGESVNGVYMIRNPPINVVKNGF